MPLATARKGAAPVTEHDVNVAGQVGELRADMRTVKHDVSNLSGKIDGLSTQMVGHVAALTASINKVHTKQERGLGFFAGVSFILFTAGGLLIALAKLVFGAHP